MFRKGSTRPRAKRLLWGGAAGPGKSMGARQMAYRRCLSTPGFEALVMRQSFPELEKSHLRRMAQDAQFFTSLGMQVVYTPSKYTLRFKHPDGPDSIVECGHLGDDLSVEKYLSSEYDMIVCDEASRYPPTALLSVSTRARSTKMAVADMGGPMVFYVTNPGGPSSDMLRDLCRDHTLDGLDEDAAHVLSQSYEPAEWGYVGATLEDNPYLDPSYEHDLAAIAVKQPWRYDQLRSGDWDVIAGRFFAGFARKTHVFEFTGGLA